MTNTPRTLHDISKAGNVNKKNIQRTYRFLARELDITPEIYHPTEFVTRIAKAVDISEKNSKAGI